MSQLSYRKSPTQNKQHHNTTTGATNGGTTGDEMRQPSPKRNLPRAPQTAPSIYTSVKRALTQGYVSYLLVFVPLGIISGAQSWNPMAVFFINFMAMIPLATLLSFATEELSASAGQSAGALLNATLGNAMELIVSTASAETCIPPHSVIPPRGLMSEFVEKLSAVALKQGEIRIVQASMLGAILSNILLGLGACLFVAGFGHDCKFNATAASTMASLLAVASISLIIPAALTTAFEVHGQVDSSYSILILSRATSMILLILYIMYLYFQFKTHTSLFEHEDSDNDKEESPTQPEGEEKVFSTLGGTVFLIAVSAIIAICAQYLVDTVDDIVRTLHVNKTFIGLIVLPIVGNVAEHVTAVTAASKNKVELAINIVIGSSMQIALLVTPSLVIIGWIFNQPMSLNFEIFDSVVFFLSVLVVTGLIQDGDSNYLEGAMLVGTYIIIAVAFFVYPDITNVLGTGTV